MLNDLINAFILVFFAEMGDKSQILAMTFATKYPIKKVIAGIFIGAFLNHGLAVLLGTFIQNYVPINTLQIISGFAFVVFSLWSLKIEDEETQEDNKMKYGAIVTVALAYFIGELGDKTQLAAITLSANSLYPILILTGTVLGMTASSIIGVFIGKKLGNKIPEFAIKILSASIFMFFGILKLVKSLPSNYITIPNIIIFTIINIVIIYLLINKTIKERKEGKESLLKNRAKQLYDYYNNMNDKIEDMCLGIDNCKYCSGNKCVLGQIKNIIKSGLEEKEIKKFTTKTLDKSTLNKNFDKIKAKESLKNTIELINKVKDINEKDSIHQIRKNLELIIYGEYINTYESKEKYEEKIQKLKNKN